MLLRSAAIAAAALYPVAATAVGYPFHPPPVGLHGGAASSHHHHHHHDPFAGSGCTCETFCNHQCAINATKPANTTYYRMTPHGVLSMDNKDTGDAHGDTSFVLSRRTIAYQCRLDPSSFFCKDLTQFSGDTKNSTDQVAAFTIETDGQWGPYLFCNPVDDKNPHGSWACKVDLGGSSSPPPPQCKVFNYSMYSGNRWAGLGAKNTSVKDMGACCTLASGKKWNYYNDTSECEIVAVAFTTKAAPGSVLGYVDNSPPPCNCTRVHKTVGRENLTVVMGSYRGAAAAGGIWFSHPEEGKCTGDQRLGDGGCTWRVVDTPKVIRAYCLYEKLDSNVERHNADCFAKCPMPKNVTGDCYLKCYSEATYSMTHDELSAPWDAAFATSNPSKGGCPPYP